MWTTHTHNVFFNFFHRVADFRFHVSTESHDIWQNYNQDISYCVREWHHIWNRVKCVDRDIKKPRASEIMINI